MAKSRKREAGVPVVQPESAPQYASDTLTETAERDRVAERAYQKFVERGGRDGRDLDDWLEAERELIRSGERNSKVESV
jgi:hypothetical protein